MTMTMTARTMTMIGLMTTTMTNYYNHCIYPQVPLVQFLYYMLFLYIELRLDIRLAIRLDFRFHMHQQFFDLIRLSIHKYQNPILHYNGINNMIRLNLKIIVQTMKTMNY